MVAARLCGVEEDIGAACRRKAHDDPVGMVLKWFECGYLLSGLDCNAGPGPFVNVPHFRNSNSG